MNDEPTKIPLIFYQSESGNEPVRDWLKALPEPERRAVGMDLMRVQWRWPVGMPLCRAMGDGLWEIRTNLSTRRTARVLICLCQGRLVALHGFIKKTRTTPSDDLALARAAKGVGTMKHKRMGSSLDDFLKEEGIFEEAQAQAVKEVIAWQLAEAMRERKISKKRLAEMLKTSRSQVDRILDPKNDITLSSLQRAAAVVGRRVTIELV